MSLVISILVAIILAVGTVELIRVAEALIASLRATEKAEKARQKYLETPDNDSDSDDDWWKTHES